MLSLGLLGHFEARLGQTPVPALPKKAQALLAYLALESATPKSRSELATLLWGDTGDDQALQSLRKALSVLRQSLGPDADTMLVVQDGGVGLNRANVTTDAVEFERLTRTGHPESLAAAVALYRGHLLSGLDLDEGPFNEWLLSRRERLRESALNTLARLLDSQTINGDTDRAIETAQRILTLEPLHEPAHRALITIYGRIGRRAAAARQYQQCVAALSQELGVKPEPATEAAYAASLAPRPAAGQQETNQEDSTIDSIRLPEGVVPASADAVALPSTVPLQRRWRAMAVIAAASVVAIGAIGLVSTRRPAEPTVRRSVAVLPMKNLSGSPEQSWLSTALTETIGAQLNAGGRFRLISPESIDRMQSSLTPPPGTGLDRKLLDSIGRGLGAELILSGDYLAVNGQLRVDVRMLDAGSGETVASANVTDEQNNLLTLVDRVADDLFAAMRLSKPRAADRVTAHAALPAPIARRAYFLGLDALRLRDGPKAADLFQQAIAVDPKFALAHANLSTTWRLLGYDQRGANAAKAAMALSETLSQEDRLNIEALYHEGSFAWDKAAERYRTLWQSYPDNIEYGLKLANVLQIAAHVKEGLAVVAEMRQLPGPDRDDPRIDFMEATIVARTGDSNRALDVIGGGVDKAKQMGSTALLARGLVKQGYYHYLLSQYDRSLPPEQDAERLFDQIGDRGGVADALRWQGVMLNDLERYEESKPKLTTALEMAEAMHYVRLKVFILIELARIDRVSGAFANAQSRLEDALATARQASDPAGIVGAITPLALLQRQRGEFSAARAGWAEGAELYKGIGDRINTSIMINNVALIDMMQGRMSEAIAELNEALASDRALNLKASMASRLGNLGQIYAWQGNFGAAEEAQAASCALYRETKAAGGALSCEIRLTYTKFLMGRHDEARTAFNALDLGTIEKISPAVNWDLARYATLALALDQDAKAAQALKDAERPFNVKFHIPDYSLRVSVAKARFDGKHGRRDEALRALDAVDREAARLGLQPILVETRSIRAEISGDARELDEAARLARAAGLAGLAPTRTRPTAKTTT